MNKVEFIKKVREKGDCFSIKKSPPCIKEIYYKNESTEQHFYIYKCDDGYVCVAEWRALSDDFIKHNKIKIHGDIKEVEIWDAFECIPYKYSKINMDIPLLLPQTNWVNYSKKKKIRNGFKRI